MHLTQLQQKFESNHDYNQDSNHTNNSTNTDSNNSTNNNSISNQANNNNNNRNITIVVPYIQDTGMFVKLKEYKYILRALNTLKTLLVKPKDKESKLHKSGVIYHFKCPHINCPDEYIGEPGRALGERIREHLKAPSPNHQHSSSTGHPLSPKCFNNIHRETQGTSRNIKEAMCICVNYPSLNRNLGKY